MPYPCPKRRCRPRPATLTTVLALLVALFPLTACAEEATDSPLIPGAWAIGFDWTTDTSFYGTGSQNAFGLTLKRHSSPSTAFRLGLGLDLGESKEEGTEEEFDFSGRSNSDGIDENHEVFVYVQWMTYRPIRERMSVFLALGPSFSYSRYHSSNVNSSPEYFRETSYNSTQRDAGILGHVGFEWFFVKRLSLAGQVATTAAYGWGDRDDTYFIERYLPTYIQYGYGGHSDTKGVRFRTGRAVFMLTAYL